MVSRWVNSGAISEREKAQLKAEYLRQLDAKPDCTICLNFWNDLRTHFLIYLKKNGLKVMIIQPKYKVNGAYLQLPAQQMLFVNEGVENDSVSILTDERATAILEKYPEFLGELIIPNPEYVMSATVADAGKVKK